MTFEIVRYGTSFGWRLMKDSTVLAESTKTRRHRHQVEEEIMTIMDGIADADIHDRGQSDSTPKDKKSSKG